MNTHADPPRRRPPFPWWEKVILFILCAVAVLAMWFFGRLHGR